MPLICYRKKKFGSTNVQMINLANAFIKRDADRGFSITIRSLYYKFIGGDHFPDDRRWTETGGKWVRDPNGTKNAQPNYDFIQELMVDARLAGLTDWYAFEDRTRNLMSFGGQTSPEDALNCTIKGYHRHRWEGQKKYVEVWVEKDAMADVLDQACSPTDTPYFSCRGYTSASELWNAAQRLRHMAQIHEQVTVIHLGDHDPSGLDMTRDIFDRIQEYAGQYSGAEIEMNRIALNMDQVKAKGKALPPSPAKIKDSRFKWYVEKFGTDDSWEMDALDKMEIANLVREKVESYMDKDALEKVVLQEDHEKGILEGLIEVMNNPPDRNPEPPQNPWKGFKHPLQDFNPK